MLLGLGISLLDLRSLGSGSSVIFSGSATVPENTTVGFTLGDFSVVGGVGSYVYTIASGNTGSKFSISGATLVLAGALSFAGTPSYALAITADNGVDTPLTLNLTLLVDGPPTIVSLAFTSNAGADNTYAIGDAISATITWSEAVTVTGTPQLTLNVGGSNKLANYASGTGTAATVLSYTIQAGDLDANGVSIASNSLALNGGTIQDSVTNNATLTHGAVSDQAANKVDGVVPTVSSVAVTSSAGADNTYIAGDVVQATATFSEAVTITGTPQLTLNVGGVSKTASYTSGSGGTGIVFAYTVQAGDTDTNGISIDPNSLALNGGTIKDAAGNNATITHGSVADNASHKVDTTAPTVSAFSPADDATGASTTNNLTVTFNENVAFAAVVSIQLKLTSDDSTVQSFTQTDIGGAISISGAVLTINPTADLTVSTGYYVLIGATSITDTGGNFFAGISVKTTWNFTAGSSFTQRQFVVGAGVLINSVSSRQWVGGNGVYINEA